MIIGSAGFILLEFLAGFKVVVSGVVVEETVVIGTLAVFEAFKLNLTRVKFFGVVDFFAGLSNIGTEFNFVEDVKLERPDNIGGVLDIAGLFETLKGDRLSVIGAVETADNYESRVGIALEFLELANGVINAELNRIGVERHDLKVVKTDDGSFLLTVAQRL